MARGVRWVRQVDGQRKGTTFQFVRMVRVATDQPFVLDEVRFRDQMDRHAFYLTSTRLFQMSPKGMPPSEVSTSTRFRGHEPVVFVLDQQVGVSQDRERLQAWKAARECLRWVE